MTTLTIGNQKGGTGKTTTAVHLAAGFAKMGYRTLLVDADAQANATLYFGIPKQPSLYDWLVRDADIRNVLTAIPPAKYGEPTADKTRLYLIASNQETRNIAQSIDDEWKMRTRLAEMAKFFDRVVIDTDPTPSLLHSVVSIATDLLLIPTELEYFSGEGFQESVKQMRAMQIKRGLNLEIAGVVPNKYRANTAEHRRNLEDLRHTPGIPIWPPIPMSIVWPMACGAGLPIFVYDPQHEAAAAAWDLIHKADEVIHAHTQTSRA